MTHLTDTVMNVGIVFGLVFALLATLSGAVYVLVLAKRLWDLGGP